MGAGFVIKARGNRSAEILIYEDVGAGWFGGVSAKQFADDLKALGQIDTIDVRINSYGGDVFDGLAIYQQLVKHEAVVTTHIDGIAASIASVIAMAGSEIRIAESAFLMIHDAWGMAVGNSGELRRKAELLDTVTEQLSGIYVARTGQPAETVRAWMSEERWFTAAEAIDAKFATTMAENVRLAARAGVPERYCYRHVPEQLACAPRPARPAEDQALCDKLAALSRRIETGRNRSALKSRGAA